jgi:hypothetical protein
MRSAGILPRHSGHKLSVVEIILGSGFMIGSGEVKTIFHEEFLDFLVGFCNQMGTVG